MELKTTKITADSRMRLKQIAAFDSMAACKVVTMCDVLERLIQAEMDKYGKWVKDESV